MYGGDTKDSIDGEIQTVWIQWTVVAELICLVRIYTAMNMAAHKLKDQWNVYEISRTIQTGSGTERYIFIIQWFSQRNNSFFLLLIIYIYIYIYIYKTYVFF
jgi:hypothetical protein